MIFWVIFGLIIALIIAFFLAWIKIIIKCDISQNEINKDGPVAVWLKFLFFKIKLFPRQKKKVNIKKFKIKNFRKMRRAEERKLRRKKEKEELKKAKKAKKSVETKDGKENPPEKKKLSENISFVLDLLKNVVAKILKKFYKYIRLDICRFDIKVATDDAAKTAVTYGVVSQSVSYILRLLYETSNTQKTKECQISVEPDFLSEKTEAHILIRLGLRVWHFPALAIHALLGFMKMKK